VKVFVFVVKEAFDSPCLPQDYKDEIEMSELVKFFNKRFTEFFVFYRKTGVISYVSKLFPGGII